MRATRLLRLCLAVLLLLTQASACGDDSGSSDPGSRADAGDDSAASPTCQVADDPSRPTLEGRVYLDIDDSDRSAWVQSFDTDVDVAQAGVDVALLGPSGEKRGVTCSDGTYAFSTTEDGFYLVEAGLDADAIVLTQNHARRLPQAVREGTVDLVAMGDSLPVVGEDPRYPAQIAEFLSELAMVNLDNVAVGGSTAAQWVPGASYFEDRLRPLLADADVVFISVGGNDGLGMLAGAVTNPDRINEIFDNVDLIADEILERVLLIIEEIRRVNPDIDIVYGLYPNYATSDEWYFLLGGLADDVAAALAEAFEIVRDRLVEQHVLLVDLYELTRDERLDDYLLDQLHFNPEGHRLYAEAAIVVLGGAWVSTRTFGLEHHWSVRPTQ